MISPQSPIALVMPSQEDIDLFITGMAECNYRRIVAFTTAEEAFRVCSRQLFAAFVVRMEMPKMSGLVLIQKLRDTGNYGIEPHLFVCNKIAPTFLHVISEYDLDYVMAAPFTKAAIVDKFRHLVNSEKNLSADEKSYRDAKSAFNNQIYDMAECHVKEILTRNPTLEKALVLMGDIKFKAGNIDAAEQLFKRALGVNAKSSTALHKLAQIMVARGDYKQSSDLLTKLADISPHSVKILEQAGLSSFEAERFDLAKKHMSKLQDIDETNKTAATVTANVMIKTGDYTGLVNALKKGYDGKELIQFLNNAGARLSQQNDNEGALKMYRAAVEQISDNPYLYAIHYNMGIAYRRQGKLHEASMHLEKSLKIKPDFEKAQTLLAEIAKRSA